MKVDLIILSKCCHEEMAQKQEFCPYCQERCETYLNEPELN